MCLFIVVLNALRKRRRYSKREKTGSGWEEKAFRLHRDGARRACKGAVQGLGDTRVPARQVVLEAQAKRLERPLKRGLAVCSIKRNITDTSEFITWTAGSQREGHHLFVILLGVSWPWQRAWNLHIHTDATWFCRGRP